MRSFDQAILEGAKEVKPFTDPYLASIRREHPQMGWGDEHGGYFRINNLRIIATTEGDWDHVSVSLSDRCPTWHEMCKVKDAFWDEEETVIQYHPAKRNYVNYHPFCLHLWRPQKQVIHIPPTWMVGPKNEQADLL